MEFQDLIGCNFDRLFNVSKLLTYQEKEFTKNKIQKFLGYNSRENPTFNAIVRSLREGEVFKEIETHGRTVLYKMDKKALKKLILQSLVMEKYEIIIHEHLKIWDARTPL